MKQMFSDKNENDASWSNSEKWRKRYTQALRWSGRRVTRTKLYWPGIFCCDAFHCLRNKLIQMKTNCSGWGRWYEVFGIANKFGQQNDGFVLASATTALFDDVFCNCLFRVCVDDSKSQIEHHILFNFRNPVIIIGVTNGLARNINTFDFANPMFS